MGSSTDQKSSIAAAPRHRVRLNIWLVAVAVAASMLEASVAAGAGPTVPLVVGLTTVTATHDNGLDYQMYRSVIAADDRAVTFLLHRAG
jgi:hypothetical protein